MFLRTFMVLKLIFFEPFRALSSLSFIKSLNVLNDLNGFKTYLFEPLRALSSLSFIKSLNVLNDLNGFKTYLFRTIESIEFIKLY